jgi:hypothetical protein
MVLQDSDRTGNLVATSNRSKAAHSINVLDTLPLKGLHQTTMTYKEIRAYDLGI